MVADRFKKNEQVFGECGDPMEMIDRYGWMFRYFLIAEMTLGQDASFTEEAFVKRYNSIWPMIWVM